MFKEQGTERLWGGESEWRWGDVPAEQKQAPTCRVGQNVRKSNLISIEAMCLLLLHYPLGKLETNGGRRGFGQYPNPVVISPGGAGQCGHPMDYIALSQNPCTSVKDSSPGTPHSSLGQGHS